MDILQRYYDEFDDMKLTTEEVLIVDDMIKEIERLREELEFYADESLYEIITVNFHYSHHRHNYPFFYREILNDRGKRAQQTLKGE